MKEATTKFNCREENTDESLLNTIKLFSKAIEISSKDDFGHTKGKFSKGEPNSKEEIQYSTLLPILVVQSAIKSKNDEYVDIHKNSFANVASTIKIAVKAAKIYCKDEQQHQKLFDPSNKKLRSDFCAISKEIRDFISLLNRQNFLEESFSLAKTFLKLLEKLAETIKTIPTRQKKTYKQLIPHIQLSIWIIIRETVYSHIMMNALEPASLAIADAFEYADQLCSNENKGFESDFDLIHCAILSTQHLKENNYDQASHYLDVALATISKTRYRTNTEYMDILAINCEKVADHYFRSDKYLATLQFLKAANRILADTPDCHITLHFKKLTPEGSRLLPNDYDHTWRIKHREDIKKKITWLQNQLIQLSKTRLESYFTSDEFPKSLFSKINPYQINVEEKSLILNLETNKIRTSLVSILCINNVDDLEIHSGPTIIVISLNDIHPDEIIKSINQVKELLDLTTQEVKKDQMRSQSLSSKDSPRSEMSSSTYRRLATNYDIFCQLYDNRNKSRAEEAACCTEEAPHKTPHTIGLTVNEGSTTRDHFPAFEGKTIYPLSNPPSIPVGHWYAYLDEKILASKIDGKIVQEIKNVLSRGRLTARHHGIRYEKFQVLGIDYTYKIRLLSDDKNDVCIYGRIAQTMVAANVSRKLIIFDHVECQVQKNHDILSPKIGH